VAGVGDLYGVPHWITLPLSASALLAIVLTGSYRRVERAAIVIGLFELAFFGVAWAARPDFTVMARDAVSIPLRDPSYMYLVAANIGAVIMPWMIFYQQSAIADKRLGARALQRGALGHGDWRGDHTTGDGRGAGGGGCHDRTEHPQSSLTTVGELSEALTPFLGPRSGAWCLGLARWGPGLLRPSFPRFLSLGDLARFAGYRRSLELHPSRAKWFYAVYAVCVVGGAGLVRWRRISCR